MIIFGVPTDTLEGVVRFALIVSHARMRHLGRALHPIETRWLLRHHFRVRHPLVDTGVIERFTDMVIAEIATRARSRT